MFWDFLSLTPESIHQVTILFSDRGTPSDLPPHERLQQPHATSGTTPRASTVWVQVPFQDRAGHPEPDRARRPDGMQGTDPDHATRDLYEAIARGRLSRPGRVEMQIMTPEEAENYRFDLFDITKVWPHADYPAASNRPAGARPQPGELLRRGRAGRLLPRQLRARHRRLARQDAPGAPVQLPRHAPPPAGPQLPPAAGQRAEGGHRETSYQRDGAMRIDANGGGGPNYWPNSYSPEPVPAYLRFRVRVKT